jgi:hypothetical protein
MKNRDQLLAQIRNMREAEKGIKRAEAAVRQARQVLGNAENEVNREFWENGGAIVEVYLYPEAGRSQMDYLSYKIRLRMKSSDGFFLITELAKYSAFSVVWKTLRRFRDRSVGQARYIISLGIVPERLTLIRVGWHHFEKKDKEWVVMK